MTTFNTLLLDIQAWDLVLDSYGNIALASPPYALAQDVASAIKLFSNELFYAPESGIPYFDEILSRFPPASLITGYMENAALTVPGVVSAQVIISSFDNRTVTGQCLFVDENNVENAVNF
jgi:hypothetical protein